MGQVTNEQVNLMLRLYEERREPKLREARDWFSANFHVKTADDLMRVCPPGSKENTYMRMVLGYWEMVASIVNRGLIDEEFFFESNGEQWVVFEQVKPVLGAWRAMFSSPHFLQPGNPVQSPGGLERKTQPRVQRSHPQSAGANATGDTGAEGPGRGQLKLSLRFTPFSVNGRGCEARPDQVRSGFRIHGGKAVFR